jgi:bifunctional DNase/RNase
MSFGISITEVNIYRLEEGVFYSQLICNNGGKDISIDARTSDAIALALRFKCPIYTTEDILNKAGIVIDIVPDEKDSSKYSVKTKPEKNISNSSDDEEFKSTDTDILEQLLDEAVKNEEYERASRIRDEINRRKSQ